jgi:hypothetical protein
MTVDEFLQRLEGVRPRGAGKWSARCPSHKDKNPSLAISEGDKGLLLKCWAGCELTAITGKLGLEIKDLFYDGLPDPRQRREAMQRHAKKQAAQRAADRARGRKADLLRHAEYLIQSTRGITIDTWTPAQLDKQLTRLADAYDVLWEEHREQR